jgi:hypothetical protein
MKKIECEKLIDISNCYDKMSKKEISWNIALKRLKVGLKNTFWVIIDSKRLK